MDNVIQLPWLSGLSSSQLKFMLNFDRLNINTNFYHMKISNVKYILAYGCPIYQVEK